MANLEISTVIGCKMNCDYCPQKVHVNNYVSKSRVTEMTFHDFKKMLSTVPKDVDIEFAGMAEPWLNKWASDMVCYAFDQGYKVGVYTTTVGMSLTDVIRIHDLPFTHFTLHLPDADGIMRLRVEDKYLKILAKVLEVLDCQKMVIGKLHPLVEELTGPVRDGSPGLFSRAGNLKTLAINKKKGALQCSACGPKIDHNVLLPNGDVLLCCMDYSQEHVIGNLLDMGYSDLFKSPEYLRVMEGLKDENSNIICRKCEVSTNI